MSSNHFPQRPELLKLIKRQFKEKGDVEYALAAVHDVSSLLKSFCCRVILYLIPSPFLVVISFREKFKFS